jgi:hypothetical protein
MLLHLLMLVGFVAALKWDIAGSAMIIFGAFLFFPRAGENYLLFASVTSIPAVLFLLARFLPPNWRRETTPDGMEQL